MGEDDLRQGTIHGGGGNLRQGTIHGGGATYGRGPDMGGGGATYSRGPDMGGGEATYGRGPYMGERTTYSRGPYMGGGGHLMAGDQTWRYSTVYKTVLIANTFDSEFCLPFEVRIYYGYTILIFM